jgi:lipid A 3-O-deacylase
LPLIRLSGVSATALAFAACASPVVQNQGFVSEPRVGGFVHDPFSPERNSGGDVNGEVLFAKPATSADPLWNALIPRPSVGTTINTEGKTSSLAYASLNWTYDVTKQIFVEGSFGGEVNNGHTGNFVPNTGGMQHFVS